MTRVTDKCSSIEGRTVSQSESGGRVLVAYDGPVGPCSVLGDSQVYHPTFNPRLVPVSVKAFLLTLKTLIPPPHAVEPPRASMPLSALQSKEARER